MDLNGNQEWHYTPDGLPETVTTWNDGGASSVVNTYAYNKRRLLTGESQASGSNTWTVGYGYDANASLSTLVYPDSLTVSYAPNALGQPTQAGTYATNVTYYPNGAIAGFTYGNGIVHTLTQNARGLPRISKDANGATAILQDEYAYDAVGNVLAITDAATGQSQRGNRDMAYDALNRLTRVTGEAGAPSPMFGIASYSYDVLDNLTHVAVTGGSQARDQTYVYDVHNRLTNIMAGGESVLGLGYDAQGNLANRNGTTHTFTFDYGNRLRAGELETYRYDVQGRRIRSSSSVGLVYSLYALSGQLLFQRDERSGKRRQYVYLGGSLVAESDVPLAGGAATVTYQHTDALGTPVAITNSSKTVTERREYEPFGYQTTPALQDGPNYTGHVADAATGLIYMQQRYCDPMIGRCLSVDPVTAYDNGDMRLFNRYVYAFNNPYTFYDPDGRCPNAFCEFFGLQETPEALQDHTFDRANEILANDNKRMMQFLGITAAAGAGTATLVEAAPVVAANSRKIAQASCLTFSLLCRDPKDEAKILEFMRDPAIEVAEDVARSSVRVIERILSRLRKAETKIPKPRVPNPVSKREIPKPTLPKPELPKPETQL